MLASPEPDVGAALQIGQLFQIFQVLGTPDDVCWPGHADLPDWQSCFPAWPPKDLSQVQASKLCYPLDVYGQQFLPWNSCTLRL